MINNDELIDCKRCGGDAAYQQKLNENVTLTSCYSCGFLSNSAMKKGSLFLEEQLELFPNLYKALTVEDEEGNIWFPSTVNISNKGMVFANGTSPQNWKWAAVLAIPILEEEKEKYPIPGKKGEYYKWRMDMTTMKEFDERDYIEALDYLGLFEDGE